MPAAHPTNPPRPRHGRHHPAADAMPGVASMYGSNLGPTHIHAVARRNQYLQEAESSRLARLAPEKPSRLRGLRQSAGRALMALGLRLHGELPHPQPGCDVCRVRMAG